MLRCVHFQFPVRLNLVHILIYIWLPQMNASSAADPEFGKGKLSGVPVRSKGKTPGRRSGGRSPEVDDRLQIILQ